MHLDLSKQNPHPATISVTCLPESYCLTVATISMTCLLESTSNSIDRYVQFNHIDCHGIVGSCNGLICLHNYSRGWDFGYQKHCFYFWNPATRTKSETSLSLPWSRELGHGTIRFGFGYDNSTNTYKAVILDFKIDGGGFRKQASTMVKVFTLGDNIWRDIQSSFPVQVTLSSLPYYKYDGVYLSNSISWLARKNHTNMKFLIISLDLGRETYTQLLLPSCCDELLPVDNPTLFVLIDSICFSHDFKGTHFVIWQLKEFGVEESWTHFLKISYLDLGINHELYQYGFQLLPLCFSENGATLIFALTIDDWDTYWTDNRVYQAILLLYSWRDNRVKKIENPNGIRWCTAKEYVESLVPTC